MCRRVTSSSLFFYQILAILCKFECKSTCFDVNLPICKVEQFLSNQNKHVLDKHLEDDHWIADLAYMAEVFKHMNGLNIKL